MLTLLNEQLFNLELQAGDLRLELGSLVRGDGHGNDGPGDATGTTECRLGRDEHVRDILVLAEKGQVEKDLDGFRVGGLGERVA